VKPISECLGSFLEILERPATRVCVGCGASFDAVGLQAFCEPCGLQIDALAKMPPLRKMDSSWPRLHVEKLGSLSGPALEMAERLAPKMRGGRLAVLAGDRGRGKTQIATYAAFDRIKRGFDSGAYWRAYDACLSVVGHDREAKLSAFQRLPFLCLDECHRIERDKLAVLESILDARYAGMKPTLLIGNWLTAAGVMNGESVSGQQLHGLGQTIIDRINETGGIIFCKWPSYRTKAP